MLLFANMMVPVVFGHEIEPPDNLQVVTGSGMVDLSWDVVMDADSYNLYLSRNSGVNSSNYKTKLGMEIRNVVSPYRLTGLNNGVTYYFVVTAEEGSEESSPSNEVSGVPLTILGSPVLFEDISVVAGLEQTKQLAFGNPICGDINNDGNIDILVPHHGRSLSLYKNEGNETFSNIIVESEINFDRGVDRHGMTFGDYDNDGNLDLFIGIGSNAGTTLNNSKLWKGDGTGKFTDVTNQVGIDLLEIRSVNWVDYDNDGYLELFVALGGGTFGTIYKNDESGFFNDITDLTGLVNAFDIVMSFADYDNDGDMDLVAGGTNQDKLYRNLGNGTFVLEPSFVGKQLARGFAWGDYNNDGFVDLYVARGTNDYHKTMFWDQTRIDFSHTKTVSDPVELTFRCDSDSNITFDLRVSNEGWKTPSVIFVGNAQYNPSTNPFVLSSTENIGVPQSIDKTKNSFYVWKEETDTVWHILFIKAAPSSVGPGFSGHIETDGIFSEQSVNYSSLKTNFKNTLFRNNGDGTFTDVTEESRTGHIGNNSGVTWGDFDNDGYLDLYAGDASDILGNRYNTLYRNLGNGTFEDVTTTAGVSAVSAVGRHYGAAWADINNDGTLDLLLANGFGWGYPLAHGKSLLYKNPGIGNNWIKLKLTGTQSNRSGIGARVVLNTANGTQSRQLNGNGGELYSQGLTPIHFGLGSASVIDSISIFWPSGIVQTLNQISANQELEIIEVDQSPQQLNAYWKLDESRGDFALDSSGNGNDGTVQGGAVWSTGKIDGALSFDGIDDYVDVGDIDLTEAFTIAAWINISSMNTNMIAGKSYGTYQFFASPTGRLFFQRNSSTPINYNAGLVVDRWYHVAVTFNTTDGMVMYLDGSVVDTNSDTSITNDNDVVTKIGATGWTPQDFFNGTLDEVRIYDRALTSDEVQDLSLIAYWWKLDEGSGNLALDSSTNGNDGTVHGDPVWTTGKIDGALSFDGIDDYVDVGDIDLTEAFTIAAWINISSMNINTIAGKSYSTYQFSTSPTGRLLFHRNSNLPINYNAGLVVDRWYHVAVTFNTTDGMVMYLDGSVVDTNSDTSITNDNDVVTKIGATGWTPQDFFNGTLDEVRMYERALTGNEVQDLSLIAYWKLDEGSGNLALDSSEAFTNGNDGTVHGDPVWTTGKIDGALSFDGIDDYVDVGDIVHGDPVWTTGKIDGALSFDGIDDYVDVGDIDLTEAFTIAAWINISSMNINTIAGKSYSTYQFSTSPTGRLLFHRNSNLPINYNAGLVVDRWYHVAVTFNTTDGMVMYLDGSVVDLHQ